MSAWDTDNERARMRQALEDARVSFITIDSILAQALREMGPEYDDDVHALIETARKYAQ